MNGDVSARWLPDPTRRYDHRYWDGNKWTEHVSRGGVASTDALAEQLPPPRAIPDAAVTTVAASPGFFRRTWRAFRSWPKWAQIVTGVVAVALVIAAIAGGGSSKDNTKLASSKKQSSAAPTTTPPTTTPPTTAPPTTTPPTTTPPTTAPTTQAPKPTAPPAPAETPGQANARRSAEQYLSLGNGFSRAGLIQQLSSSFGEGFSLEDATYGVDATHTDWNAQACLSAKGYLKLSAFSHAGLVEQLSSEAGEQFTPDEAEYGVTCAGL